MKLKIKVDKDGLRYYIKSAFNPKMNLYRELIKTKRLATYRRADGREDGRPGLNFLAGRPIK